MRKIDVRVNGEMVSRDVPDNRLLLDFVRYDLNLTGSKEGCSVGVCGACTMILNGRTVSACLVPAVFADGGELTTIEGLAEDGRLQPIQKAFIEFGGFQCGICTPGQIMAAKSLLDTNPHPTRDEIKAWMMGNLCRCTGYYKIIESIEAVAEGKVS
jgi:carbon-monoxide dehydrogenase small subunit